MNLESPTPFIRNGCRNVVLEVVMEEDRAEADRQCTEISSHCTAHTFALGIAQNKVSKRSVRSGGPAAGAKWGSHFSRGCSVGGRNCAIATFVAGTPFDGHTPRATDLGDNHSQTYCAISPASSCSRM
jgi:hypothetical protein